MNYKDAKDYSVKFLKNYEYEFKGNIGYKKLNDAYLYCTFRKNMTGNLFFIDYGIFYLFEGYIDYELKDLPKPGEFHIDGNGSRVFGLPFFDLQTLASNDLEIYLSKILLFLNEISSFSFLKDEEKFYKYLEDKKIGIIQINRFEELKKYMAI